MRNIRYIIMQQPRHILFVPFLCLSLLLMSACGLSSGTDATISNVANSTHLYVLDGSISSPQSQHFVVFHPGDTHAMSLPAGLMSQDHQRIYTATPNNGQTTVLVTDATTGRTIRSLTLSGTYSTASYDYTNAVTSFDGHWLALREQQTTTTSSEFAFVNTLNGHVENITLQGQFDLDAISPDGSRLYLLQQINDAAGHYYVRLYQVNQHQLYPNVIADKSDINDPRMIGSGLTRQVASDGTRDYTLYIDTRENIAFVHALPLTGNLYLARCIDLPTGKSPALLRYYTLALSADGSTLYATNAALGVSVAISVADTAALNDDIISTTKFTSTPVTGNMQTLDKGAVLSPNQSTLYVLGTHGITAIDVSKGIFEQSYAPQQTFTGVAISSDGRTLYATQPQDGITVINVASGQTQKIIHSPAHAPWGIEWISQ
ncbi:MAG TPA: hypothetical protein DHW02_17945 [Ktedonobacter sp.]|nr:hypothetical protein [Ktedonobacter sp.]